MASSVRPCARPLALLLAAGLALGGCGDSVEVVELEPLTMPDNHDAEALAVQQQAAADPATSPEEMAAGTETGTAGEMEGTVASQPLSPAQPREVVVPDGIAERYHTVTLGVRLPDGSEQRLTLPIGSEHEQEGLQLRVGALLPDFIIRGNTITSATLEPENPALWVEMLHDGEAVYRGWLFGDYPDLTPPLVEGYQLALIAIDASEEVKP